jgi:hypothetical protein
MEILGVNVIRSDGQQIIFSECLYFVAHVVPVR